MQQSEEPAAPPPSAHQRLWFRPHEGRLWFSDWIAGEIIAVDDAGVCELIVRHESLPLCFDFLPGGRPVLVSNQQMALLTESRRV